MAVRTNFGIAKFTLMPGFHLATQLLRHGLHAIAYAQYRHAQFKSSLWCKVGFVFVDAGMTAGQYHAIGAKISHKLIAHVTRVNFTVNVRFANTASNQLGDL